MPKIRDEYDVGAAFAAIENELMSSMVRNMERHKVEEIGEEKEWEMWQALQLKSLDKYKRQNKEKYGTQFQDINKRIGNILIRMNEDGQMDQERKILKAIKNGADLTKASDAMSGRFFEINDRKMDALIKATTGEIRKAETAVLRKADDVYRKTIFNAQVYANSGAGTYEKVVDMATKDFIAAGLNCVEYKNGARHTLSDYADMAVRTAAKRAYLQGEGTKRQEWGIHTVIVNQRSDTGPGGVCPECLPFVGKVFIDDVWSGGKEGEKDEDGEELPLLSDAIGAGLYHPRCRDSHTTYFPGISTPPSGKITKKDVQEAVETEKEEARQQYAERQAEKYERLAETRLDPENRQQYEARAGEWRERAENDVEKPSETGIINLAKPIDSIFLISESGTAKFAKQEIIDEMGTSPIGKKVLEWIGNSKARIAVYEDDYGNGNRGDQNGDLIRLFPRNIKNCKQAAQTVIHEMTHYHYNIGQSQHAEAVCFGMEKLHLTGNEVLTKEEWEYVKKLAIDNYPDFNWEEGGYGDYSKISIIGK